MAVVAFVLALVVAEVGARLWLGERFLPGVRTGRPVDAIGILDRDVGWRIAADVERELGGTGFRYHARTNSRGHRDTEHARERSPGTRRIVLLGDSVAWGWGVDDGQGLGDLLEGLFERPLEVVNLAVPGYGTDQELWALEREGLAYRPDVVLLEVCANDPFGNEKGRAHGLPKPYYQRVGDDSWSLRNRPLPYDGSTERTRAIPVWESLAARSALYKLAVGELEPGADRRAEMLHGAEGLAPTEAMLDPGSVTGWLLGRIAEACDGAGALLVVFTVPPVSDRASVERNRLPHAAGTDPHDLFALSRAVRRLGHEHGFRVLSVDREIVDAVQAGETICIPDGHWNARGHEIAAHSLATQLAPLLRDPPRTK